MKPLHPEKLAVAVRDICNHWPSYKHIKATVWKAHPAQTGTFSFQGMPQNLPKDTEDNLQDLRDKQQYLNSPN